MKTLIFITALALVSGVHMETCPSAEDIYPCDCDIEGNGDVRVLCSDKSLSDQSELRRVLRSLSGKQNVKLDLRYFTLGSVPSDLFSGVGVKQLYISGCDLDTLSYGGPALKGLEDTLEDLTITRSFTGDQIQAKLQLGHLNRLKSLTLYYNTIAEIGDDWFQDGPVSLESIIITDNQIGKIGRNAFANLVNLKNIFVAGNPIRQVQRSMFPNPANNLELLNLDDNGLTALPEDIFTNMPKLVTVQLERNSIDVIDERVWSRVWEQLASITLKGNPIRCDDSLSWTFDLDGPLTYSSDCDSPEEVRGQRIVYFIHSHRGE